MANWKGTAVPSEGSINSLYFNTNLSVEETKEKLSKLPFVQDTGEMYFVTNLKTDDGLIEVSVMVVKMGDVYGIATESFLNGEFNSMNIVFASDLSPEEGIDFVGWNSELNANTNILSNIQEGASMNIDMTEIMSFQTMANDLISSVVSTTPFTQGEDKNILMHPRNADGTMNKDVNLYPRTKVGNLLASNGSKFTMPNVAYKQGGGTPVPNSGVVEKVYFNTNLSNDEVKALIDSLTFSWSDSDYTKIYMVVSNNHINAQSIVIGKRRYNINEDWQYFIVLNDNSSGSSIETSIWDGVNGWALDNIAFSGTLVAEYNGIPIGNQNDKLSSLFSITPFTSGGLFETNEDGTPNIDKPIQTGISEERVNELIDLKITGWLGGES